MGWVLGTWFATGGDEAIPRVQITVNDYPFYVKTWDENWNTPLGSNMWTLMAPVPASRGTLDDECSSAGFAEVPQGPAAAGGRRANEIIRKRKFQVVLGIDYQQWGARLWVEENVTPPEHRPPCNELLPVQMRTWLRDKTYRLATVQEGLRKMHPQEYPVLRYNDDKCRILSEVQRHFLEPVVDGGFTWQLWEVGEVDEVYHLRLQRFLVDTELLRKEVYGSGDSMTLPNDVLRVRRVEWEYGDRRKNPRGLTRIDSKQADQAYPGWEDTHGEPNSFIEEPSPLTLDITMVPPPDDPGRIGVRYVPGSDDDGVCPPTPIPRMFTWALKWGVIADLLHKEGEANDPVRAQAAEELYQLGVNLARALLGDQNG